MAFLTEVHSDVFNLHRGISNVLVCVSGHDLLLLPDSNDDAVFSFGKNGASVGLAEGARLVLLIELEEGVLLLANTDSRLANTTRDSLHDIELIDSNILGARFSLLLLVVDMEARPVG